MERVLVTTSASQLEVDALLYWNTNRLASLAAHHFLVDCHLIGQQLLNMMPFFIVPVDHPCENSNINLIALLQWRRSWRLQTFPCLLASTYLIIAVTSSLVAWLPKFLFISRNWYISNTLPMPSQTQYSAVMEKRVSECFWQQQSAIEFDIVAVHPCVEIP